MCEIISKIQFVVPVPNSQPSSVLSQSLRPRIFPKNNGEKSVKSVKRKKPHPYYSAQLTVEECNYQSVILKNKSAKW